jgi:UDP-2-acetamido-3-amino-2,3-dideoxy-glucuronate N-acetyltransferase
VIHPTAEIERGASVGPNTNIWHNVHVRAGAVIGANCNLGHSVFVDAGAVVGNNVKLQNRVSIYRGVTLEDGVFVGPHVSFTNDKYPRSIHPDGSVIDDDDWQAVRTLVRYGASIGAGAIILPGVTIGRWAMVGAAALVVHDVPDHGLVAGKPGVLIGYACTCGRRLRLGNERWNCSNCGEQYALPPLNEAARLD